MMPFKISMVRGAPVWDSLPVAKIIDYPLEPRDYKPYTQARLCLNEESLWVRMWAFEALPSQSSMMMVKLNLFPGQSGKYLSLSAQYGGEVVCEVCEGASAVPMAEYFVLPRVKTFQSEDLQGIYWGVVFELPRTALKKVYGVNEIKAGHRAAGNLYKIDRDPCSEHYGSFYRVNFKDSARGYTDAYFGEFEMVEY